MSIIVAIFLGVVQGLTEFLPVSSSGHLILFQHIFNMDGDLLMFNIILHIATLVAVCFVFRGQICALVRHPFKKTNACLVIATAITCGMVVIFKDIIDRTFTYKILPFSFLATAIILFLTNFIPRNDREVGIKTSIAVGIAQGIAVIPGLSRSGTTISTILATGVKRESAATFSFLMSIPVIIASFLYEIIGAVTSGDIGAIIPPIIPTALAFVAAVISGIFAIKIMLRVIQNVKLHWFSLYLVILAVVCFVVF